MSAAPPVTPETLLPPSRHAEAMLARAMADDLPAPLRESLTPQTAPARFLPWLAAARGVSLWGPRWSEARQRAITIAWPRIAAQIGTRAAVTALLPYVDAELIDAVAHPARFVLGRAVLGRAPVGHKPFVARYLVRVRTAAPARALVLGRGPLRRRVLRTPSREAFEQALVALRIAKSPETQVRVSFQHMRPLTVADAPPLDIAPRVNAWVDRQTL